MTRWIILQYDSIKDRSTDELAELKVRHNLTGVERLLSDSMIKEKYCHAHEFLNREGKKQLTLFFTVKNYKHKNESGRAVGSINSQQMGLFIKVAF